MVDTTSLAGIRAASAAKPNTGALTQAQIDAATAAVVAAGGKSTDRANRLPGETATEANARITAGYKAQVKPELTQEGAAAGATIEFVRKGAGGVGKYEEVYGIGIPIPKTRTTAYGNTYDAQGNLISGSGKKITIDPKTLAKVGSKIFQMLGGILYYDGLPFTGVEGGKTYKDGVETKSTDSTTKTVKTSVKNADGTTTITYTDDTVVTLDASGTPVVKKVDSPLGGDLSNPAFSIVEGILKNYDMKGVADSIAKIRADYPEIASADILALLKFDTRYNAPYLERFAGNAALIKKGLPTLNDDLYLKAEKEYETIFKAYDVGSLANRKMYATLIGNSMDAVDVTGRLKIGYDRLKSDKNIEEAFRKFYPSLGTGDIVAAMLNPDEMLPMLERKAAAAEIGGSYLAQGLEASKISAESLAAYGVTKAGAQAGVRYIAQALPRGKFLSQISGETGINYTQETAEEITFKKNVKAQQEEDILKAKEIGRFSGTSGVMGSKSLASQQRGAGLI
jgi:hypothetical protein